VVDLVIEWLGLLLVTNYFLYICMLLLHLLVLCDLYHYFLLMFYPLVLWRLDIGRQGFFILVGWDILVVAFQRTLVT